MLPLEDSAEPIVKSTAKPLINTITRKQFQLTKFFIKQRRKVLIICLLILKCGVYRDLLSVASYGA